MMGASRCIPAILNRPFTQRLPFEAIYDLGYLQVYNKFPVFLPSDFLDLDYNTPSSAATSSAVVGAQSENHPGAAFIAATPRAYFPDVNNLIGDALQKKFLYEASINNFLSETMNFFLKDSEIPGVKLPVAVSSRTAADNLVMNPEKSYYMEISLRMGADQVMCEGPRNAGAGGGTAAGRNKWAALPMMMRGYLYGPPIEIVQMSGSQTRSNYDPTYNPETGELSIIDEPLVCSYREGSVLSGNVPGGYDQVGANANLQSTTAAGFMYKTYFAMNLQDPAYQAYTPPHFYGKSSLVVYYSPPEELEAGEPDDVKNIWIKTQSKSYYLEQYVTGSRTATAAAAVPGSYDFEVLSSDMLCKMVPGTGSISGQYNTRMKIESSMEIYNEQHPNILTIENFAGGTVGEGGGPVTPKIEHVWYISPKWVCPVLDFSSSYAVVDQTDNQNLFGYNPETTTTKTVITNSFHRDTTGKGLWGGYGTDPYDTTAMELVNTNSGDRPDLNKDNNYEKGLYFSIKFPFKGNSEATGLAAITTDAQLGEVNKVSVNRQLTANEYKATGSLAPQLGFEEKDYKIGQFSEQKSISEAIIVIPYFEEEVTILPEDHHAGSDGFLVDSQGGKPPLKFPGNEIYKTREIIPGKHFLPIHKTLFENLLSMKLVQQRDFYTRELENLETPFVGFESELSVDQAKMTDIYKMIEVLIGNDEQNIPGYEMPPELNFIDFLVDPFQMLVLPVNSQLVKQELIDIYQGIMPDSSLRAVKETVATTVYPDQGIIMQPADGFTDQAPSWIPSAIRFESIADGSGAVPYPVTNYGAHQFLSPAPILEYHKNEIHQFASITDSIVPIKTSKEFYSKLKFMTFTVKQKSVKDYKIYRGKQIARAVKSKIDMSISDPTKIKYNLQKIVDVNQVMFKERFGYNWPYDDFSLIQSTKIDIEAEMRK